MKITNTIWFWILQLFGWGLFVFSQTLNEIFKIDYPTKTYVILYSIITILFGILCTTLLRYYLKNQLSFDQYRKKEIIQIIIVYGITALLLSVSFFVTNPIHEFYEAQASQLHVGHSDIHRIDEYTFLESLLKAFMVVFFWLFLYLLIKNSRRINQNKLERLQLEANLKEAQLNTLKGQINPHFMFNSLNNIRGLMLEDVEKSREMITRLSEMLRYSLTKNNINTISLKNEMEMIENYIELSKIQLEDRLTFSKEIPSNLLDIKIPPMLIQMLIENAVKHGISNQKEGGVVILKVLEKNKDLQIEVSNTGKLNTSKNTTKIGLKNIEERLRLLYVGKAKFSLSEHNNLVTATIQIPL